MILVHKSCNILKSESAFFYTGHHIVRAISLLPEYFWFLHVHFVSPYPRQRVRKLSLPLPLQEQPEIFNFKVDVEHTLTGRNVSIHIWQKNSIPVCSHTYHS